MERKTAKMNVNVDNSLRLTATLIEKINGNEDLLIEILLRVPAKSLVKFKCVSKQWLSIISDKKFCYNHSARNPNVTSALYYYADFFGSTLKSISLKGHQNLPSLPLFDGFEAKEGNTITVVHACNGLMLCSEHGKYICICNLTTNKYTVLVPGPRSLNSVMLACISYDPAKSPYYNVVLVSRPNLIYIYFSENKSWKSLQVIEELHKANHVAFWDGSINWIHYPNTHLKFDVDKETLTTFSLPPKLSFLRDEMIQYFGECGENLILIQYTPKRVVGFRILEMKKGATDWTVKQRANLRPITQMYPENKQFHVLSVLKGSHENDVVLVLASNYKIFKFNLRCKTIEVIRDSGPAVLMDLGLFRYFCSGRVYHFIESLVPV